MTDPATSQSIVLFAAATVLLFAAAHDVALRTIPNIVPLIVAAAGLGLNALNGQLAPALLGGGLVFAGAWYCWRHGWMGGGDVKLLGASALLMPPTSTPELVLNTAMAGGVLALLYVVLARLLPGGTMPRPAGLPARIWRAERRRIRRGLSLPYGCAIAAGALLTLCSPDGFG
jgi:prepilin peptidase CpaA